MKKLFLLLPLLLLSFNASALNMFKTGTLPDAFTNHVFSIVCTNPETEYLQFRVKNNSSLTDSEILIAGGKGLYTMLSGQRRPNITSDTAYRKGAVGFYSVSITARNIVANQPLAPIPYELQASCVKKVNNQFVELPGSDNQIVFVTSTLN